MSLNSIIIMGRMCNDPELKTTQNGVSVTSFNVAVDRPYQKSGQEKETDFIPCVAWRNTAEFICKYFHKGSMICIQGSLTTRKYTDKSGQQRTAYEILTDHAHFTGEKKTAENGAQAAQSAPAAYTAPAAAPTPAPSYSSGGFAEVPYDDDLPF